MQKKVKMSDFDGMVHRRPAPCYGVDTTENSIAAESSAFMDRSRIRTETVWQPSVQSRKAQKAARGEYPVPMSGEFVSRPASVQKAVNRFMGGQKYRSIQQQDEE